MNQAATVEVHPGKRLLDEAGPEDYEVASIAHPGTNRLSRLFRQHPHRGNETSRKRIRRILVPVDLSPASASVIDGALTIAQQCNAALAILHVVDINAQIESESSQSLMNRLWNDGVSRLANLVSSLDSHVEAETLIEEGLPWETIVEKSKEYDLMVLGKRTARKRGGLFGQQTSQRVLDSAACPVLVVPCRN